MFCRFAFCHEVNVTLKEHKQISVHFTFYFTAGSRDIVKWPMVSNHFSGLERTARFFRARVVMKIKLARSEQSIKKNFGATVSNSHQQRSVFFLILCFLNCAFDKSDQQLGCATLVNR